MKYLIKGKLYDPILFGDEDEDWGSNFGEDPTCGDCGCHVGQQHKKYCDIERCPACGGQLISCDCGVIYEVTDMGKVPSLIKKQEIENKNMEKAYQNIIEKMQDKKTNKKSDSQM